MHDDPAGVPNPLPCFLTNPPRILIKALDKWLSQGGSDDGDKPAVVAALRDAIQELQGSGVRLDSIPVLIRDDDPGLRVVGVGAAPSSDALLL